MCSGAGGSSQDRSIINSIAAIIAEGTAADKLFFLSNCNGRYDFLALLPGRAQLSFRHYQQLVEQACREHGCIMLWCCHTAQAIKYLTAGHIFYSLACTPDRLVHDSGRFLPDHSCIDAGAVARQAEASFHNLFSLAHSFLSGARYHAAQHQLNTAAFSLHQATEHALRALLLVLTGYKGRGHGLDGLLRHCAYCAPSLCRLFPQHTVAEKELFQQLNSAYLHTRYVSHYTIDAATVALLLGRIDQLHRQVRCLFEERLLTFKNHIQCLPN